MDDLVKDKRRAMRRKRNFVAKALHEDKQFRHKVVEKKRTRKNIRIQEVEQWLEEEEITNEQDLQHQAVFQDQQGSLGVSPEESSKSS